MTDPTISQDAREAAYAPCPTCKQYSHSIGCDAVAAAFNHFQAMFDHRGDGMPTQYCYDEQTRDAAQVLMAAAHLRTPASGEAGEMVERLRAEVQFFRDNRPVTEGVSSTEKLCDEAADLITRLSATPIEALQQRVERLEVENARLRGQIAKTANNINIAGSHYDHAITAIDEMVRQIKQDARAALGDDVG